MAVGLEAIRELLDAGYTPEQIRELGRSVDQARTNARGAGYTPEYLAGLDNPATLALRNTVSLLTGQEEIDREERLARLAGEQQIARVGTGMGLLDFERSRFNDAVERAQNPFNVVGYNKLLAGLPEGYGGSSTGMIANRKFIDPESPYNDPQFAELLKQLYAFGTPTAAGQGPSGAGGQGGVPAGGGLLPASAGAGAPMSEANRAGMTNADYANLPADDPLRYGRITQDRPLPPGYSRPSDDEINRRFLPGGGRGGNFGAFAAGGKMTLREPVVGMGMRTGRPLFTAAENGPEDMKWGGDRLGFQPRPGVSRETPRWGAPQGGFVDSPRWPIQPPIDQPQAPLPMPRFENPPMPSFRDQVAAAFGAGTGDPRYSDKLDINRDGRIDITDRSLAAAGRTPYGPIGVPPPRFPMPSPWRTFAAGGTVKLAPDDPARYGNPGRFGGTTFTPTAPAAPPQNRFTVGAGGGYTPLSAPPAANPASSPAVALPPQPTVDPGAARTAAAKDLYQALRLNPFAPPELLMALEQGYPPSPGSVTERFRANVDPVLLEQLFGITQGFGIPVKTYAHDIARYNTPGLQIGSVRR